MDRELIRKELAMYGILINDDEVCTVLADGSKIETPLETQLLSLQENIKKNKEVVKELWRDLSQYFHNKPISIIAGNDATKRMFTEAVKHLNRILLDMGVARQIVKEQLYRDIDTFSEAYMRKVVDYKLAIDWLQHLVSADRYRISLLKAFHGTGGSKQVHAIQGPWGGLDLPMGERVWSYGEEGENLSGREREKEMQQRYKLPDTFDDPYKFEEGFYWREMRNEPYAFGDDENSPYPHRNLLWNS